MRSWESGRFLNTTALAGDDEMLRYRVSLRQALTGANAAFDAADWSAYWQGTETDQDTYEVRRAVPPRTPPVQLDRTFRFDESTLGVEFTAVKSLVSGSLGHEVVYGIEATRSELDELRDGLQTNLTTGATTPTILGETFPLRDLPLSTVVEIGAFVQDEMRLDDSRWTLVPALRVDYYDLAPETDRIYRETIPRRNRRVSTKFRSLPSSVRRTGSATGSASFSSTRTAFVRRRPRTSTSGSKCRCSTSVRFRTRTCGPRRATVSRRACG